MKSILNWFSVPTTDFDRARRFYQNILNMKMPEAKTSNGGRMAAFVPMSGLGCNGAIDDDPVHKPSMNGITLYLNVDGEIDAVLGRIESAGGKITQPKMSIGEHGFIALFQDLEGNKMGLHSM